MKVTFPALLFVVFLVLKLTGVIAWSWWWVTAPLWAGLAIVAMIALVALLGFGVAKALKCLLVACACTALLGCTDAERASMFALGDEANITCWSGSAVIFSDVSTGKVAQLDGDGITFRSKTTGNYVRAFADCIVTAK